jgi:hypothetical protein
MYREGPLAGGACGSRPTETGGPSIGTKTGVASRLAQHCSGTWHGQLPGHLAGATARAPGGALLGHLAGHRQGVYGECPGSGADERVDVEGVELVPEVGD